LMLRRMVFTTILRAKKYAIKLAANAAITVLRVDQIIMAKQAGGPKRNGGGFRGMNVVSLAETEDDTAAATTTTNI